MHPVVRKFETQWRVQQIARAQWQSVVSESLSLDMYSCGNYDSVSLEIFIGHWLSTRFCAGCRLQDRAVFSRYVRVHVQAYLGCRVVFIVTYIFGILASARCRSPRVELTAVASDSPSEARPRRTRAQTLSSLNGSVWYIVVSAAQQFHPRQKSVCLFLSLSTLSPAILALTRARDSRRRSFGRTYPPPKARGRCSDPR